MKKSILALFVTIMGPSVAHANTTEMVFYPKGDLSSAVAHFFHQGDKQESYGFLFDKGFDKEQIMYAQPNNYTIETQKEGKVKLLFSATDRYSYMQQIKRSDFIVDNVGKRSTLLVCGGDCAGSKECVTMQNIVTVIVPQEQKVVQYKGLDDNLQELKLKEWKISEDTYTLFAPKVKGACIYMELESLSAQKEKSEAKSEMAIVKKPNSRIYDNKDLFVKGDVVVSASGKEQLKKLTESMKSKETLLVRVFQDTVDPVRLALRYPTAHLFSAARAQVITKELLSLGIENSRFEIKVIEDKLQKTRVETEITPVQ